MGLTLRILIPGRPSSWKRPGKSKSGGRYTIAEMRQHKRRIAGFGLIAMHDAGLRPLTGAITMRCDFYQRRKRTATPDDDNLRKLIADALEGVCYVNDSQIVEGTQAKHDTRIVGGIPRTVVVIEEAADEVAASKPKARAKR